MFRITHRKKKKTNKPDRIRPLTEYVASLSALPVYCHDVTTEGGGPRTEEASLPFI